MTRRFPAMLALLSVCAIALGACGDDDDDLVSPGEQAMLSVALAGSRDTLFESVVVGIDRVELIPEDGAPVLLMDSIGALDLLDFQDSVTATLTPAREIEAGRYRSIRLLVDSARVTLREGLSFADGSRTRELAIPSAVADGIDIDLTGAAGEPQGEGLVVRDTTDLIIDFDITQNFPVQRGAAGSAGFEGVQFTPAFRVAERSVVGSISCTLVGPDSLVLENMKVIAEREDGVGDGPDGTVLATGFADVAGSYKIWFLAPTTYRVHVVVPQGFATDPVDREITLEPGEDMPHAHFEISDTTSAAGAADVQSAPGRRILCP